MEMENQTFFFGHSGKHGVAYMEFIFVSDLFKAGRQYNLTNIFLIPIFHKTNLSLTGNSIYYLF